MNIHPTAIVAPDAQLDEGVEIGPYTIIGPDVKIGKNTVIGPHTVIDRYTQIGEGCQISQFCSLGAPPQDIKFAGEKTGLVIGNFNMIREYVSIHRGTTADRGLTIIGDRNMIMAYCHVAHNCILENNVIMANASTLAGHVHLEEYAFVSGLSGIHQFCRVGAHAMVGGASGVNKDIPPYTIANGNRATLFGLNVIGLQRRGFSEATIAAIKHAYRKIFRSDLLLEEALEKAAAEVEDCPEVRHFIDFIHKSKRSICR